MLLFCFCVCFFFGNHQRRVCLFGFKSIEKISKTWSDNELFPFWRMNFYSPQTRMSNRRSQCAKNGKEKLHFLSHKMMESPTQNATWSLSKHVITCSFSQSSANSSSCDSCSHAQKSAIQTSRRSKNRSSN